MISSISLRLPQKTCGLFDTGSAGDAFDIASFDLGIPDDIDQSLFSFGEVSPGSSSKRVSGGTSGLSIAAVVDQNAQIKHEMPSHTEDLDWDLDFMDPLGGLEDPLGDENLDAFVNLDSFLMEDSFLDNESQINEQPPAEVKPVIDFFANPGMLEPVSFIPTTLFDTLKEEDVFQQPSTSKTITPKSGRKRKAPSSKATAETASFKTSKLTEAISNSQIDHDYIGKSQAQPCAIQLPNKSHVSKGKRSATKDVRIPSTASDDSDVSSTSMVDVTSLDPLDKQTVRRIKNNVASKKSREQRKQKFADLDLEAETLIVRNDQLRVKIVELEKMAKEMKALLVAKMAGKA